VNVGSTCCCRFSNTKFWSDIKEYKCTVMQYIGELCRYLLLAKPSPLEKQHKLRIAIGNGLRPDIWADFQVLPWLFGKGVVCAIDWLHACCAAALTCVVGTSWRVCRSGSTSLKSASFTAQQREMSRCSTIAAAKRREGKNPPRPPPCLVCASLLLGCH
jgi:acyl-CoA synthetase (AMP-forming)/AMP-acid ligase II